MISASSSASRILPRTWVVRAFALGLLAASLPGCGAISSSQKADPQKTGPASSQSVSATGEGSSRQPEGEPDDPASWLADTPYVPLEGVEKATFEKVDPKRTPNGGSFTLELKFDPPNAPQACVDAVSELNEFNVAFEHMVFSEYDGNFKALDSAKESPRVQGAAIRSAENMNLIDAYDGVLKECADIPGDPESAIERFGEHDGVHVRTKEQDLIIVVKSRGNRHIWMTFANLDHDEAKAFSDAQIDLFNRSVDNAN